MAVEHDLTSGLSSTWIVTIGKFYFAGLGRTYEGYHKGDHIPIVPGFVITKLQSHAMVFSSRREAFALARNIGGMVIRAN